MVRTQCCDVANETDSAKSINATAFDSHVKIAKVLLLHIIINNSVIV